MVTVMCLRFVFLLVTRLAAWSWLCRREESWKDAEILLCATSSRSCGGSPGRGRSLPGRTGR
jgi:hypothetical protein